MDLQPNSNRNDTVITHLLLIERTLPLFHTYQGLSSQLEHKMILLYISRTTRIHLDRRALRSIIKPRPNFGYILVFTYFANSTTDANFRPFSGHFNYIATNLYRYTWLTKNIDLMFLKKCSRTKVSEKDHVYEVDHEHRKMCFAFLIKRA